MRNSILVKVVLLSSALALYGCGDDSDDGGGSGGSSGSGATGGNGATGGTGATGGAGGSGGTAGMAAGGSGDKRRAEGGDFDTGEQPSVGSLPVKAGTGLPTIQK